MPQNMKSANKFRTVLDLSVPFKPFQVPFMSTMRHVQGGTPNFAGQVFL